MKQGDRVMVTCEGRTVEAEIILISPNGKSLAFSFEAILDGHVGMMPVLLGDDGVYRSLITGSALTIVGEQ